MKTSAIRSRYGILRYAGSGPSGYVWIGSAGPDAQEGKIVLYEHRISDEAVTEALRRELAKVVALRHQNVISLFDASVEEGRLWIAAEFLESKSFPTYARSWPDAERRAAVTLGIMDAVAAAHGMGILHGALDPACVRVTAAGQAKVMGFGLQPGGEEQRLPAESLSPRIRYRAPEMLATGEASQSADQYSIGQIGLWALGGLPGDATQAQALRDVLIRASSSSPDDRFASVADLRAAFAARCGAAGLAVEQAPVHGR